MGVEGEPPLAGLRAAPWKLFGSGAPEEPMPKHRCIRRLSEEPTPWCLVQNRIEAKSGYRHRLNRRVKKRHRCIGRPMFQRWCQDPRRRFFSTGWTGEASVHTIGVMTSAVRRRFLSTGWTGDASVQSIGSTGGLCVSCQDFNGYFGLWVTGWTDATPPRGIGSSGDTQIFSWPLEQRLQDLVVYIYASPRPFEDCWSPKTPHTHPRTSPSHTRAHRSYP